jgi:sugar/nucleoside kinase (ribokinase family)
VGAPALIAIVGQSVADHIRAPGQADAVRLGGSPVFAIEALRDDPARAVILTRGADAALRAPLHGAGFEVVVGPGRRTFVSELEIFGDGERRHAVAAFGDPFTPEDVATWMAPALARAAVVVLGAQWRGDFPPETLRALAAAGRTLLLDGQGPARPELLGPLRLEGPLEPAWVDGVGVLKCSDEEAGALFGDRIGGVPVVVVSHGHLGATVHRDGHAVRVVGEPVLGLADTVGSGDMFLALLGLGLDEGLDPVDAAREACAAVSDRLRRRLETRP